MKIIETPSPITGHRFRHTGFLIWISSKFGISTARLWAGILSDRATKRYYSERFMIQERFKSLYEQFCLETGVDHSDVIYDNPDAEIEIEFKQKANAVLWDVIEAGEADTIAAQFNQQTGEASNKILSYDEIMRSIELSKPAAPERKLLDF